MIFDGFPDLTAGDALNDVDFQSSHRPFLIAKVDHSFSGPCDAVAAAFAAASATQSCAMKQSFHPSTFHHFG